MSESKEQDATTSNSKTKKKRATRKKPASSGNEKYAKRSDLDDLTTALSSDIERVRAQIPRDRLVLVVIGGLLAGIFAAANGLWKLGGYVSDVMINEVSDRIEAVQPTAFAISMIVIAVISYFCSKQTIAIITRYKEQSAGKEAMLLGIIFGLGIMAGLFYAGPHVTISNNTFLQYGLIIFSAVSGFMIWFIFNRPAHQDFLTVVLMIVLIGICWYVRFFAPETQQLIMVAFVMGCLVNVAKKKLALIDAYK